MSEPRFDVLFEGVLQPDADPVQARARLGAAFRLDAAAVERLFCGKTLVIKRDADPATAQRYQRIFAEAGALVRLRALGDESVSQTETPASPRLAVESAPPRPEQPSQPLPGSSPSASTLSTSAEFDQLEEPPPVQAPALDLSHLSLVGGSDWDLSDCTPPPPATQIPDISHLSLAEIEPSHSEDDPLKSSP